MGDGQALSHQSVADVDLHRLLHHRRIHQPFPDRPAERMTTMTAAQDESAPVVLRRIRLIAVAGWIAFAVPVLITGGWRGLLGLTCSGLVTMINFLWLEEIVDAL